MSIRGDLLSADLSNVFQMLALNRKRGRLVVQEQGNLLAKRRLYISEDRVALDERPPTRPLAALLVEMGVVSYPHYHAAIDRGARYHKDPLQLLQQQGVLTPGHVEEAQRRIEEEEILEVFLWRNVSFTLEEGGADPVNSHFFNMDHLIMEAARRYDEWRHVMEQSGHGRRLYTRTGLCEDTTKLDLEPVQHIVLDQVDGLRGCSQIVEATGLSRYYVDIALLKLHEQGYVEPLGLLDLISNGDRMVADQRIEEGILLFRSAMQFDRRNITLHKRLANAYLQIGRLAKGAAHFRFCATCLLASGHRREAISIYRNILKILPTDYRTLLTCTKLISEEQGPVSQEDLEVVEQARRLLLFYQDTGQDGTCLDLAEVLLRIHSDDEDLLAQVARLSLRLGRAEAAARAYSRLAAHRRSQGDLHGALEIYRTLIGIDPSNRREVEAQIADIQAILEKGRRRVRRGRLVIVGLVVAILLAAVGVVYTSMARAMLEKLEIGTVNTSEEARQAAAQFAGVGQRFPFTPAAREASSKEKAWNRRAEQLEEELSTRNDASRNRALRAVLEARELFEEGDRLHRLQLLEEARTRYQAAVAVIREADCSWPELEEAEKRVADITRYFEQGRGLVKAAQEALAAGDRRAAYAQLVKVAQGFELLPEYQELRLPLRVVTAPSGAKVSIRETGEEVYGPSDISLPLRGQFTLTVEALGFRPASRQLTMPPSCYDIAVALDVVEEVNHEVAAPVISATEIDAGRVALLARNGRVIFLEVASGATESRGNETLYSTRTRGAALRGGVATVSEAGDVRLLLPAELGQGWSVSPFRRAEAAIDPVPFGEDLLVAVAPGELCLLSGADGSPLWRVDLPAAPAALTACSEAIACLLADGSLLVLDPAQGNARQRHPGPFTGTPAFDGQQRLVVRRSDTGLVRLEGPDKETVLVELSGKLEAGPLGTAGLVAASVAGQGLLIISDQGQAWLPMPEPVSGLSPGRGTRALVTLASGRLLVADLQAPGLVLAAGAGRGPAGGPALTERALVIPYEKGLVAVVPLP